ncbi:hypothetical protein EX30DRAFT_386470 [Ascodesmis nigricans]|uniref:Uncharacterized protein n=1 Tax=Ascodesmis nigricans TaxID=341454 RepID=A0A4S2MRL9_9PEZI|nr:hypothetical protein EX30DRAFT_386470 [Ascodesmis nigricans]
MGGGCVAKSTHNSISRPTHSRESVLVFTSDTLNKSSAALNGQRRHKTSRNTHNEGEGRESTHQSSNSQSVAPVCECEVVFTSLRRRLVLTATLPPGKTSYGGRMGGGWKRRTVEGERSVVGGGGGERMSLWLSAISVAFGGQWEEPLGRGATGLVALGAQGRQQQTELGQECDGACGTDDVETTAGDAEQRETRSWMGSAEG